MRVLAVVVVVGTVVAAGAISSISSRQRTDEERSPRGTFESLVSPADYPESPHAWPAGEPIVIECWGDAQDQRRTRRLARSFRKANRLESAQELATAKREIAGMTLWQAVTDNPNAREYEAEAAAADAANAEVERLSAELHATTLAMFDLYQQAGPPSFTLRTANGTRYGWDPERRRTGLPPFRDVGHVFPIDRVFQHTEWNAVRAAEAALDQATNGGFGRHFLRARSARDALESALDEQNRRNALGVAIRQDAREACAR